MVLDTSSVLFGAALCVTLFLRHAKLSNKVTKNNDTITLEDLHQAEQYLKQTGLIRRTPLLKNYTLPSKQRINLKLENLQNTGSFKIRGMCNTFRVHEKDIRTKGAVTLSAGNAGRSFAFLCGSMKVKSVVCMPESVPKERVNIIEGLGSRVELVPNSELMNTVNRYIDTEGRTLIHPFDDKDLVVGHGSCGLEILEDQPNCDCVLVCCGGGGLVSGIAAAIKLSGSKAKVFAVEPEGASGMYTSFKLGRPAHYPEDFDLTTIAHGLAPPFAGDITYKYCKQFVDDIFTVNDEQLAEATKYCFEQGLVVETSGCASVAAVMAGYVNDYKNIVCVLTGRNISPQEITYCFTGEIDKLKDH